MSRFAPYLGIVVALALGVCISVFIGSTNVMRAPVVVAPSIVSTATGSILLATSTADASDITKKEPIFSPVPAPDSTVSTFLPAEPVSFDASAATLRAALVNIICSASAGSRIRSMSGSGVIIDPKGIILTNAHIAQYFLLADRGVSCTIRSGSPAVDKYKAALIYISPLWLRANPDVLTQASANGTGEYDFALLAVSESVSSLPLPSSFPSVPLSKNPPLPDTPVVIASYGAQFLESSQIASNLFPTVVFGSVKRVFTFQTNTIDMLALGGSAAAQEGSSGGGVADASGTLVGTITTSTVTGTTDTRSLNALSASYIRAQYASEMGEALDLLLAESPATAVSDFASQIPTLEAIITAHLP